MNREELLSKAVPHGSDDPCTCQGCWACKGRAIGCTCDIDWDGLAEMRLDGML